MTSADSQQPPPYQSTPLEAKCHCGGVSIIIPSPPTRVNECQCSICYNYGAAWAYYARDEVLVTADPATDQYIWGDKDLEFHRCGKCGCVTHWWPTKKYSTDPSAEMGVNTRMLDKKVLEGVERYSGRKIQAPDKP